MRTQKGDDFQALSIEKVLQIKEPSIAKAVGRPRGAANLTRADPKILVAKEAEAATVAAQAVTPAKRALAKEAPTKGYSKHERSTKRDPSGFELVQGSRGRGRGRGKGQGKGRGQGGPITRSKISN